MTSKPNVSIRLPSLFWVGPRGSTDIYRAQVLALSASEAAVKYIRAADKYRGYPVADGAQAVVEVVDIEHQTAPELFAVNGEILDIRYSAERYVIDQKMTKQEIIDALQAPGFPKPDTSDD